MIALQKPRTSIPQPAARETAPLPIAPRGGAVEVSFFDRPPLFGFVDIFDPHHPEFMVRKSMENVHLRQVVLFERTRHIAFLRQPGVRPPTTCASTARLIELRLLDGGTLRGITHSHGGQRRGLFLVPTGIPGVERFYVPTSAIQEVLSVRTIGELLCGSGPVTPEMVEASFQRERAAAAKATPEQKASIAPTSAGGGDKPKLGEILLDQGFISREDLGGALAAQASQRGRRLGEVLIDLGLVSHKMIAVGLAIQYGVPFLSLAGRALDPALRGMVPAELAHRAQIVPLARDGNRLRIAVADPGHVDFEEELRTATGGLAIEPVVAIPQEIVRAQDALYGAIAA